CESNRNKRDAPRPSPAHIGGTEAGGPDVCEPHPVSRFRRAAGERGRAVAGGTPPRRPRRRPALLRCRLHRDLLPADLPGAAAAARECVVLPVLRGGGAGRLPFLQIVPPQTGGAA